MSVEKVIEFADKLTNICVEFQKNFDELVEEYGTHKVITQEIIKKQSYTGDESDFDKIEIINYAPEPVEEPIEITDSTELVAEKPVELVTKKPKTGRPRKYFSADEVKNSKKKYIKTLSKLNNKKRVFFTPEEKKLRQKAATERYRAKVKKLYEEKLTT